MHTTTSNSQRPVGSADLCPICWHAAPAHAEDCERRDAALVLVPVAVTWERIEDTLCAAWEGGSNYWLECYDFRAPTDPADAAKVQHRYQNALHAGGACLVRLLEEGDELEPLTREKLIAGLAIFAAAHPRHFANMQNDNGDAETGDVLLQCCLLGKVVYG